MRLVLDTDVLIAGLRSPTGASAELMRLARRGKVCLLASVALFIEYEAQCLEAEHCAAAGLSETDMRRFLDTFATLIEPVTTHYLWRPQLRDPADEMVLEAAVNGRADALVSFNHRDFGAAPARFGIALLLPSDALTRIR
ncbi:MAG: putative toxin-antitoxin system toxin component, PIN family [Pseudomonadota bacterium]|nr:putative toxin-antitoxin system toxin component, PIN family [Gammaproteobacteria bacterium]MDQ3582199.1 putative toxin-antitoxin system toxin component, PIN family [Pseudomonadota bacterium]